MVPKVMNSIAGNEVCSASNSTRAGCLRQRDGS